LHLQAVWGLEADKVGLVFIAAVVPTFFCKQLVWVNQFHVDTDSNLVIIASPLGGYWTDKFGSEWPCVAFLLLSLPWWVVIIIEYKLAFFIAVFALQCMLSIALSLKWLPTYLFTAAFFTSGVIAPVTAELAAVARDLDGIGCEYCGNIQDILLMTVVLDAHIYGAFNLVYGIGSTGLYFSPTTPRWLISRIVGPLIGGQVSFCL